MERKVLLAIALWLCVETRAAAIGKEGAHSLERRQRRVRAERWRCREDLERVSFN